MNLTYIKKQLQFWADKKDVLHVKKIINERRSSSSKKKSRRTDSKHFYFR